jgi:hypothetical protein
MWNGQSNNMRIKIINQSPGARSYLNGLVSIPENDFVYLASNLNLEIITDPQFISDIELGFVKINDGITDYGASVVIDFLRTSATQEVITLFEKNDKDLKISSAVGSVDSETGIAVITIPIGANGRYMDEGEAWFSVANELDRIKKAEIVDVDNVLGYGADTIIKSLHDDDIAEEFQGWRIPNKFGHVDVDTMAGYGYIPEGLYFRITGVKDPSNKTGNLFVNLKWGKTG